MEYGRTAVRPYGNRQANSVKMPAQILYFFCFALLFIFLIPLPASAGPAQEAWEAYMAGDFETVEAIVTLAVGDTGVGIKEHARLYLALGCADAMQNRDRTAAAAFEQALILDPTIKLTAADIPPPVWKVFKPVWDRFNQAGRLTLPSTADTTNSFKAAKAALDTLIQYVGVSHEPSTAMKSLLFPGWGHYVEGRPEGQWHAAAQLLLTAGWITGLILTDGVREDYLRADTEEEISSKYDQYNNLYRLTWGLGVAAAANYLFAQWRFFSAPPPVEFQIGFDQSGAPRVEAELRIKN